MKKRRTALLTSLLALLLCVSMLMGTTLAWFTDSVSSQNNQILAGSLDVELEQYVDGKWVRVNESTNVFEEDALWEPGHTEVVYLRIANVGDLALKYGFGVNIAEETGSVNVLGEDFKLSDHIRYGIILSDSQETYANREAARSALKVSQLINQGYSSNAGSLLPAGEKYVTMVVYMPEEVGNEANYATGAAIPTIKLGLTLMATQEVHESDSFGSDYDASAEVPGFDFPDNVFNDNVTVPVETDNEGKLSAAVTLQGDRTTAEVPAGVLLANGVTDLNLTTGNVDQSEANVTLSENESQLSVDVHVAGVSPDNTVPMTITLEGIAPKGLNIGNYKVYHVENGQTVEMTYVASDAAFSAHNQFKYDPATGNMVLYVATFSEFAAVLDEVNPWNGDIATAFAGGTGTEEDPYLIANADQLAYFSQMVSRNNDPYGDASYKLIANVNLNGEQTQKEDKKLTVFYPVGYWKQGEGTNAAGEETWYTYGGSFRGTFDGNGNVIYNIYQNTWLMDGAYENGYWDDAMGIFGYVNGGTVKNLTVNKFASDGEFTPTGVIAAYACNATFENIALVDCNPRVYNTGNGGIVGIGGNSDDPETYKLTFNNITIDNTNKISALWGSWDVACGGLVGMFRGAGHVYMNNCHVAAQIDVNNDVCGNYQYYWYRYAGMLVGTNKNMYTDADGRVRPETDKFHATNCTVHFGDWNDYYYCELVANSLASYTHDHQMSRLVEIKAIEGTKITYLDDTTGTVPASGRYNYVIVNGAEGTENATCYHFVDGAVWNHEDAGTETVNGETVLKEDKQHIYLPFNQLFTGYGWGVNHVPIYDDASQNVFPGVTILPRDVADSVEKFERAETAKTMYMANQTIKIGDLFAAKADSAVDIVTDNVQVFVSPADSTSTAGGLYAANKVDWTQGTITVTGVGAATITISDYNYCAPTSFAIEVTPEGNYKLTPLAEIAATDKVIVVMSKDGTHYALNGGYGASEAPFAEKIKVSSRGYVTSDVSDYIVWNITKDAGNLTIYPNGTTSEWLYCTSNNNGVRVGTNTDKVFTIDATSGYLQHTETGRYLGVYTPNPDWRCYTSINANIADQTLSFYALRDGVVCQHASITTTEVAAKCEEDGYKTVICDGCEKEFLNVVYPAIGHEYVNGTCTICNGAEPAISYVLTDWANIKTNDEVIITVTTTEGKTYALPSDGGTDVAPQAIKVFVNRGTAIYREQDETIRWNIANDGTGNLTLYPMGQTQTWLYSTNTNNGIRVGTNSGKSFVVADNGYLQHVATSRYVGIYEDLVNVAKKDWRSYETVNTNIGGQTLKFFVKTIKTCDQHSYDAGVVTDPTCTEGGFTTYTCAACGYSYAGNEVAATGHTWKDPDCNNPKTCTVCGATEGAALPHSWTAATCQKLETCSRCGAMQGELADHNYVNGVCSVCGAEKPGSTPEETTGTWTLVTDASTLKAGDKLVVASNTGFVAGNISSDFMSKLQATFSNDKKTITVIPGDVVVLTLGGTQGSWTLQNSEGKLLGATAVKKLAWGSGTTTWSISIDNNYNATIQSATSSYGRFLYNVSSPRFTTYTSATSTSMLLPQLYRLEKACEHTNVENVDEQAATCTENGYTAGVYCSDCQTYTEGHEVIDALGHNTATVVTKAATCEETGSKTTACSRCDYKLVEEIPVTDHNYVNGVCNVCGGTKPTEAKTSTYTFSDYTAGTQYAENEVHELDENVTITTTQCHFTTQLRIYSSSTHNGYAIIAVAGNISKLTLNAGHKVDKIKIYGSTDGKTWTESPIATIATTTTSYKDYAVELDTGYKYLKLDVAGENQIRIAAMTLTWLPE